MAGKKGKSGRKPGFHNPSAGRKAFPAEEKKQTIQVTIRPETLRILAQEGQTAALTVNQHAARILEMYAEAVNLENSS